MKKLFVLAVTVGLLALSAFAQDSDRGMATLKIKTATLSVNYGRPALAGRDVEKDLLSRLPVGGEWRMGMNEATTLTTDGDLLIADKRVAAGKYVLVAKRGEGDKWSLVIKDEQDHVVAETPMKFEKAKDSAERLTITLMDAAGGGKLYLQWGTFSLAMQFKKA